MGNYWRNSINFKDERLWAYLRLILCLWVRVNLYKQGSLIIPTRGSEALTNLFCSKEWKKPTRLLSMLRKHKKHIIWQTWSPGGESFVNRVFFFCCLNPYCPFWQSCQMVSTKSFVMCVSKTGSHYRGVERSDTTLARSGFPVVIQGKVERIWLLNICLLKH